MAKKPMNKMIVLPLFLAVVTLTAAGALTGVHLLTAPLVERNQLNKQYEGYKRILEIDSFDTVKEHTLSAELSGAGVTLKQSFMIGDQEIGTVYDANITGFSSDLIFQVGFKGDVYAGFNLISSKESPGFGADYLVNVDGWIKGVPATQEVLVDSAANAGITVTSSALKNVLSLIAGDYNGGRA